MPIVVVIHVDAYFSLEDIRLDGIKLLSELVSY